MFFLVSLMMAGGAGLRAEDDDFEPFWCDEPETFQNGVICEYTSACYFDGTPGTEYSMWEYWIDWYGPFCASTPWDILPETIDNEMGFACGSFANGYGDPSGWVEGNGGVTIGPYEVVIPDEFAGWCVDGEFTCNFQLEGTCPS
jgi:hypothetical protein